MTSTITQPVNGIKDPVSAKANTEGFVILFWEECIFIDREGYNFHLNNFLTQHRLLNDRNGFFILLHIPWIFICRLQEVSDSSVSLRCMFHTPALACWQGTRGPTEAGTGLSIHTRLMRRGGHNRTWEVWETHPTAWVMQGQFSLGLHSECSLPKRQGQTRVRPARPLKT